MQAAIAGGVVVPWRRVTIRRKALCYAVAAALTGSAGASDLAQLARSVVRIVNHSQRGDWSSPWDASPVVETTGSGFVVGDGLVLTNAHVVSDSRLLLAWRFNEPDPFEVEILHVAHDCDLALLRPVRPGSLDGVPPLEIGALPELGAVVDTLGHVLGGTQVSSTRGVVSRIEPQLYLHSGADVHLTALTDAAINPGASGGPVVERGQVVGVAFQANPELTSVGYFIPDEVIRRFLRDVEDGRYDGYPELGAETSGLENQALRSYVGMAAHETGARVFIVIPGSSADGRIHRGDVILEVDGRQVANDGTVADGAARIPFGMLVDRRQIGETVAIRLLRDGRRFDLGVPLRGLDRNRLGNVYDRPPRYFVYGGLVFVALDVELLRTYGAPWRAKAPRELVHAFVVRPRLEPERFLQEAVVLLRRLKHPVNADMAWWNNEIVERVNGRDVTSLEVLIEALELADVEYHLIEFAGNRRFSVLEKRRAEQANREIRETYGVQQDRYP